MYIVYNYHFHIYGWNSNCHRQPQETTEHIHWHSSIATETHLGNQLQCNWNSPGESAWLPPSLIVSSVFPPLIAGPQEMGLDLYKGHNHMICFSPYKYKLNATCRWTHKFLDNLRLFLPALFLELCLCFLADIFIRQRIRYGQSSLQLFLIFTEIANKIFKKNVHAMKKQLILHTGKPNSIWHYIKNQQCVQ